MFILVITVYALLAVFELKPLYKQKLMREFWVDTVLYFFSFSIAILLSLDVKVPSPVNPIRELITSIFGK